MKRRAIVRGQAQHKYFAIPRSAEDGESIVITTPGVDLYGDRVMPDGADLSGYLANPVVLWLHDAYGYTDSAGVPIGTARSLEIVPGVGIKCTAIDWLAGDAFVDRIKNAWDQGKIRAASIGFLPMDDGWKPNEHGGYDFTKWRLLEFSLVPIPANPEAVRGGLSVAMKMFGVELDTDLVKRRMPAGRAAAAPGETEPSDPLAAADEDLASAIRSLLAAYSAATDPELALDLLALTGDLAEDLDELREIASGTEEEDAATAGARRAPARRKAGRVLSQKNLDRLKSAMEAIGAVVAEEEAEGEGAGDMGMGGKASGEAPAADDGQAAARVKAAVAEAFTEFGQRGGA